MENYTINEHLDLCLHGDFIRGEVLEIGSNYILVFDDDENLEYKVNKDLVICNPEIKRGYFVEINLVSDHAAHRVYVNPEGREKQYFQDFSR